MKKSIDNYRIFYLIFILVRVLDLWSTKLNMDRFGFDLNLEASPVSRLLMTGGMNHFIFWNLIMSFVVLLVFVFLRKNKISQGVLIGFTTINSFVVLSNFAIWAFV